MLLSLFAHKLSFSAGCDSEREGLSLDTAELLSAEIYTSLVRGRG